MKITSDYPNTEFAPKAQFKTALVYEKMGEIDNAVEEYVKLAYKYPDDELIPEVMSRLGGYFQKKGLELKKQADPLRENEDDKSKSEV
ncbi:MAG: tetratricopeptide repeat protein, partial [Verrucomicrobiales bacterium]